MVGSTWTSVGMNGVKRQYTIYYVSFTNKFSVTQSLLTTYDEWFVHVISIKVPANYSLQNTLSYNHSNFNI